MKKTDNIPETGPGAKCQYRHCSNVIPDGKPPNARFCSDEHRKREWEKSNPRIASPAAVKSLPVKAETLARIEKAMRLTLSVLMLGTPKITVPKAVEDEVFEYLRGD